MTIIAIIMEVIKIVLLGKITNNLFQKNVKLKI